MKRLENWMIIELAQPTIVANVYNDPNTFPGWEVQLRFVDIDPVARLLYTENGVYKLGSPDSLWWKSKNFITFH
jgi:hypothetical protein